MPVGNQPPPISDAQIVKSLAFPYQLGKLGFPAIADPNDVVFQHIMALLLTGRNEMVMNVDFGVNIHDFVFGTLTPILMARISSTVTRAINQYIPEATVMSVIPTQTPGEDGFGTTVVLSIMYRVAGQQYNQQIPISPTTQGM